MLILTIWCSPTGENGKSGKQICTIHRRLCSAAGPISAKLRRPCSINPSPFFTPSLLQLSQLLSKWTTHHQYLRKSISKKFQVPSPPSRRCQVNSFPASSFPPLRGCPRLPAFTPSHRPPRLQRPISREYSIINRWCNPGWSSSPRARSPYLP